MDLDDLLEDLLEDAADAARRQMRVAGQVVGGTAKRGARRAARAVGTATALVLLALTLLILLPGDPGVLRTVVGMLSLAGAAGAGGIAAMAHVGERRDPVSQARKARRQGQPVPPRALDDLGVLPRDIRTTWDRLLEARRLVGDLAGDGWVAGPALLELDEDIARLHRLLVADRRSEKVGGTRSAALRRQVHELADLLVALADEAVQAQVEARDERPGVAATITDARDHLVSLRKAREEVRDIDRQVRGAEG